MMPVPDRPSGSFMSNNTDILFDRAGSIAIVTLNRPKALNALTLPMIRELHPRLQGWADDPSVTAVVIRGAGDRAFCAGGDVRAVYDAGLAARDGVGNSELTATFFREEYRLNRSIRKFPKPYVALLDGITMGGGVGLSIHGSHRVVTERTLFAMPETGIGLFPDVGGSYFLPRCPGEIGVYLGLTGERLGAADSLYSGIGTHCVPSEAVDRVIDDLSVSPFAGDPRADIETVIARHAVDAGEAPLSEHRQMIDACFGFDTVEEIFGALSRAGTGWAMATLETLSKMSPTSLKVTLREIRLGAKLDFDAALVMEYRLSQSFMQGHDFYEGIRAVLVDKDRNPRWKPENLNDISEEEVERYFAPLGQRDLQFAD